MNAEEYLRAGEIEKALAELQEQTRAQPAKAELRVFLFQLLSVMGQWERAMTQLNVAADLDADALLLAHTYRPALNAEAYRAEVFAGRRSPLFLGEPPAWAGLLCQALPLLAKGEHEAAARLRDAAFEAAGAVGGTIDDAPFEWIADADPRLGPMLEALIDGKYYWVPLERVRELRIEKPANLRDAVWALVTFVWANGGEATGMIPSRYPGSEAATDSALRLARKTEWTDAGSGFFLGRGQRMLATDQGEYPLFETRRVVLASAAAAPPSEGGSHG